MCVRNDLNSMSLNKTSHITKIKLSDEKEPKYIFFGFVYRFYLVNVAQFRLLPLLTESLP